MFCRMMMLSFLSVLLFVSAVQADVLRPGAWPSGGGDQGVSKLPAGYQAKRVVSEMDGADSTHPREMTGRAAEPVDPVIIASGMLVEPGARPDFPIFVIPDSFPPPNIVSVLIKGLPDEYRLSRGVEQGDGAWVIELKQFGNVWSTRSDGVETLALIVPPNPVRNAELSLVAVADYGEGRTATKTKTIAITARGEPLEASAGNSLSAGPERTQAGMALSQWARPVPGGNAYSGGLPSGELPEKLAENSAVSLKGVVEPTEPTAPAEPVPLGISADRQDHALGDQAGAGKDTAVTVPVQSDGPSSLAAHPAGADKESNGTSAKPESRNATQGGKSPGERAVVFFQAVPGPVERPPSREGAATAPRASDRAPPQTRVTPESGQASDQAQSGISTALLQPRTSDGHVKAREPDVDFVEMLMRRGDDLLSQGDLVGARLFYEQAVARGEPRAAAAMGKTFDPLIHESLRVRGLHFDPRVAAQWYRKAIEGGSPEGTDRLKALSVWLAEHGN